MKKPAPAEDSISRRALALRDSAWFGPFPERAIAALAEAGRIRTLPDKACLFRQGTESTSLAVIVRGGVRSGTLTSDGQEFAFSLLKPGAVVGLVSALDGLGAVNTATAHGETEVLVVPREALLAVLDEEPVLYRHVVRMLCYRMRKAYGAIDDLTLVPLPQRLARKICTLAVAEHSGAALEGEVTLRLTQTDLAVLLGVTRPIVNRALKALEAQGLLAVRYRRLVIRDFAALHARCAEQPLFSI